VATPAGLGRQIRQHIERGSGGAGLSLPLRKASTCNGNQEDYSCFKCYEPSVHATFLYTFLFFKKSSTFRLIWDLFLHMTVFKSITYI